MKKKGIKRVMSVLMCCILGLGLIGSINQKVVNAATNVIVDGIAPNQIVNGVSRTMAVTGTGLMAIKKVKVEDHYFGTYDCTILYQDNDVMNIKVPPIYNNGLAVMNFYDANNNFLARQTFYVTSGVVLNSVTPNPVTRGSSITVTGSNLKYGNDWRFLQGPNDEWVGVPSNSVTTETKATMTVPSTLAPGTYDLAYFDVSGYECARITITVK